MYSPTPEEEKMSEEVKIGLILASVIIGFVINLFLIWKIDKTNKIEHNKITALAIGNSLFWIAIAVIESKL
jgi:hypothetical protein